jgi:hypothetical protein
MRVASDGLFGVMRAPRQLIYVRDFSSITGIYDDRTPARVCRWLSALLPRHAGGSASEHSN